jgi:hypothetical protein
MDVEDGMFVVQLLISRKICHNVASVVDMYLLIHLRALVSTTSPTLVRVTFQAQLQQHNKIFAATIASTPGGKIVVNFIKTTNAVTCVRKQYSVEVIDPQHLAALGCISVSNSADACFDAMRTGRKFQQDMSKFITFIL